MISEEQGRRKEEGGYGRGKGEGTKEEEGREATREGENEERAERKEKAGGGKGRDGVKGKDNKTNRTWLKPSVSVTIHRIPKATSIETS